MSETEELTFDDETLTIKLKHLIKVRGGFKSHITKQFNKTDILLKDISFQPSCLFEETNL